MPLTRIPRPVMSVVIQYSAPTTIPGSIMCCWPVPVLRRQSGHPGGYWQIRRHSPICSSPGTQAECQLLLKSQNAHPPRCWRHSCDPGRLVAGQNPFLPPITSHSIVLPYCPAILNRVAAPASFSPCWMAEVWFLERCRPPRRRIPRSSQACFVQSRLLANIEANLALRRLRSPRIASSREGLDLVNP